MPHIDARAMRVLVSEPHRGCPSTAIQAGRGGRIYPMKSWQAWLPLSLTLLSVGAHAAAPAPVATELGAVTLLDGSAKLLRGATWYKVVAGTRVEESDILDVAERGQAQIEFAGGGIFNMVGPGFVYLPPAKAKGGPVALFVPQGWVKVVAKPPGLQLRTASFNVTVADAIVVMHVTKASVEFFMEQGEGRMVEVTASGADGQAHELKRGEYWAKAATGAVTTVSRAPRVFVDQMPRHFIDQLHEFAGRLKSPPPLVVDHEISFGEAEPWLAGRDRAVFERRFTGRLRDPVFRSAVMPNAARYPTWDRILNPEKYEPKKTPDKVEPKKAPAK